MNIHEKEGEKPCNRRNRNLFSVFKILLGFEMVIYFSAKFHKAGVKAFPLHAVGEMKVSTEA